jgi:hypothetical protein
MKNTSESVVIKPSPPSCISTSKTACPNKLKYAPTLTSVRPVTHVADVAVNKAVRNGVDCPFLVDIGSIKINAPISIRRANTTAILLAGFILFFKSNDRIILTTSSNQILYQVYQIFFHVLGESKIKIG